MNLVLFRPGEVIAPGLARLTDDRARHLLDVLGCEPGRTLRVGVPDGPVGSGEVRRVAAERVEISFSLSETEPAVPRVDLLLALPRPRVLGRVIEHVVALGVRRLVITRASRVEKSYFQARGLGPDQLSEHVWAGLEQAGDTRVPEVLVFDRLKPLVEDRLDDLLGPGRRFCAHPEAERSLGAVANGVRGRVAIAIGPEGGWLPFEVDLLGGVGFEPVHLGARVLRVETACTLALAWLALREQECDQPP